MKDPLTLETLDAKKLQVFMVGYCCDLGASACESRTGAEKGPECLRQLMEGHTIQWFEDDEKSANLWDCGDIKGLEWDKV